MNNDILEAFQEANKKRRTARIAIVSSILAIIFIFVFLFYSAASNFSEQGIQATLKNLQTKMNPVANKFISEIPDMTGRIFPVYIESLEKEFDDNKDEIRDSFMKEVNVLEEYSQEQKPLFETEIKKLVANSEQVFFDELQKIVGSDAVPKKMDKIGEQYRLAFEDKLANLIDVTFKDHINTADEIHKQAKIIANNRVLNKPPVGLQEGIGITLETIGYDLQETTNGQG